MPAQGEGIETMAEGRSGRAASTDLGPNTLLGVVRVGLVGALELVVVVEVVAAVVVEVVAAEVVARGAAGIAVVLVVV